MNFTKTDLDRFILNKDGRETIETEQKEFSNYRKVVAYGSSNIVILSCCFQPLVFTDYKTPADAYNAMMTAITSDS